MEFTTPQVLAILAILALVAVGFVKKSLKFVKIVIICGAIAFLLLKVLPSLGL